MLLAHKIRLYPTKAQEEYFRKACGTARFVYNTVLSEWNKLYKTGSKPDAGSLKIAFNADKYVKYPWMKEVHRDTHSQPFADLDKAFRAFFRGKAKHPVFKKKHKSKEAFYIACDKMSVTDDTVKMPKIGKVRMAESLRLIGSIKSARVSLRADMWFISIQVECDPPKKPKTANIPIGIDLGISATATCTDGSFYKSPKALRKRLKRLRRVNKSFSRTIKGSENRRKAAKRLAKIHYQISNVRSDFIHKMTTEIVRKSQAIVIEDLAVKNMLKNRKLSKALSDESFGEIRRQIEYKCKIYGVPLLISDRFFPSSKLCHVCGWKNTNQKLSDRVFRCPECGLVMDRDLNASHNLSKKLPEAIGEVKPVDRLEPGPVKVRTGMKQESNGVHLCTQKE